MEIVKLDLFTIMSQGRDGVYGHLYDEQGQVVSFPHAQEAEQFICTFVMGRGSHFRLGDFIVAQYSEPRRSSMAGPVENQPKPVTSNILEPVEPDIIENMDDKFGAYYQASLEANLAINDANKARAAGNAALDAVEQAIEIGGPYLLKLIAPAVAGDDITQDQADSKCRLTAIRDKLSGMLGS